MTGDLLVDGVRSIGVHNGVVRVQFFKLGADGKAIDSTVLHIPATQVRTIVEGLVKEAK